MTLCLSDCSADILFVIDSSGSIDESKYSNIKEFVNDVISYHYISETETQFATMIYSDDPLLKFGFDRYYSQVEIQSNVRLIEFVGGRTNTAKALNFVSDELTSGQKGNRRDSKDILVLINDGNTTDSTSDLMTAVNELKNDHDYTIMAVGLYNTGGDQGTNLNAVVSDPNYLFLADTSNLNRIVTDLVDVLRACKRPTTPRPPYASELTS